MTNPRKFIESADLGPALLATETAALETAENDFDIDKLSAGVVSGNTLIDFSNVPSMAVRAGVSLSMLFASRVATAAMKEGDDQDDWLATYTSTLDRLGFGLAGTAVAKNSFKKVGLRVHKAIIPFLTVAFGGAALGPIILAGLKNLQESDADQPWIKIFDRETKRFSAQEMHFAAVSSDATDTHVRYAVARLNIKTAVTTVLFFNLTQAEADFESVTTTMTTNNSLMAVTEPDLRLRLAALTKSFIADAKLS